MNIYKEVTLHVRHAGGGHVASCYIAHVLADNGLTSRIAANRIDPNNRVKPCPASKRPYIEAALRTLGKLKSK